ncbi:ABC transporter ATP-binding protein/permease [Roseomonas marmotae]|uniref:ABC transporter ATP-binding protein/permease n=1 Tax=Roseomonas marmotae TaxID=2768161 RepID=A0ABS3KIE0_9PROT|nr:ABC transporter ATP-binding protein/permease [Roseomonas marmotae]MBO1076730.1 ABC transporter ATP-binding protein/permease [Roseomonas marmotae]QTI77974.1 ABC transporter ATP-binding protein/permease [Roseomonas marmotae]
MRRLLPFLRDAWALARPYWNSEDKWKARGLLAVVILLNLSLVGMNVLLTYWQAAFYDALQEKDFPAFSQLLLWGHWRESGSFMPGFSIIAALFIVVAVYQLYLNQALQIRWRRWLVGQMLHEWLDRHAYYRMGLTEGGADNPDQRIADDTRLYVSSTLNLGLGLMSAVVTLISFIFVLWGLSGPMAVFGINIPGYLVWVALIYSAIGTWLAHLIGRKLVGLNFNQQRVEADFRFSLVRVRENMEGIALHGGEAQEEAGLRARFAAVMNNWWAIMTATKQLTFFTAGFGQVAVIFPFIVAAPAYFAGRVALGGLVQTTRAFGEVQGAMSWFVTAYDELAAWRATVERLTGFHYAVSAARAAAEEGPRVSPSSGEALEAEGLRLALPNGRPLTEDASLRVEPGEAVLITGVSGSGKSTLFRALAGIWPFGSGQIHQPDGEVLFLPQRPYMPLGTLKRAICYPHDPAEHSDAEVTAALDKAGLAALAPRLHETDAWERRLSGGEQQRLAVARALLVRPRWLFLDEATASLDTAAERMLYTTLRRELPDTAIISIAHRPAVVEFHDRVLRLSEGRLAPSQLQETPT